MRLRRKIALWLCPELKRESDEAWRFRVHIQDYRHWLYMFPEVEQVLKSLSVTVRGGEPIKLGTPAADEVCTIGGLREQLFRMKEMRPAAQVGERIIPAAGNKPCMVVVGYRPSAEEFAKSPPNYSGGL